VQYLFQEQRIVREKDTFDVELKTQNFYFDGQEFPSGDVDALRLTLGPKGVTKTVFVYKENAAAKYLN